MSLAATDGSIECLAQKKNIFCMKKKMNFIWGTSKMHVISVIYSTCLVYVGLAICGLMNTSD